MYYYQNGPVQTSWSSLDILIGPQVPVRLVGLRQTGLNRFNLSVDNAITDHLNYLTGTFNNCCYSAIFGQKKTETVLVQTD